MLCTLFVIALLQVFSSSADTNCLAKNGICQEDNLWCGGGYQTGLCSGGTARRCCVPLKPFCKGVTIVSRDQWSARAPKSASALRQRPIPTVFIHHTAGPYCANINDCKAKVKAIQDYHMDSRGWSDIGYSFLVGGDGVVYEGRGWRRSGAHTVGYNDRSLAFSFMGNYENIKPTSASLSAVKTLLNCGMSSGYIAANYQLSGHRDVAATACPGQNLYDVINKWTHYSNKKP